MSLTIFSVGSVFLCRSVKGTQQLCDFLWVLLLPDNATIQLYYKQLLNNVENLHLVIYKENKLDAYSYFLLHKKQTTNQ